MCCLLKMEDSAKFLQSHSSRVNKIYNFVPNSTFITIPSNTCTKQSIAHFSFHHTPQGVSTLLFITNLVMSIASVTPGTPWKLGCNSAFNLLSHVLLIIILRINYLAVVVIISSILSPSSDSLCTAFQSCEESKCTTGCSVNLMLHKTVSGQ